jgi:hypothetical protein
MLTFMSFARIVVVSADTLVHNTPDKDDPKKLLLLSEPTWTVGSQILLNCTSGYQRLTIESLEHYISLAEKLEQVYPVGTLVISSTGVVANLTQATVLKDNHLYVDGNVGFLQADSTLTINGQIYVVEHARTKVMVSPPVHIFCRKADDVSQVFLMATTTTTITTLTTTIIIPAVVTTVPPCDLSSGLSGSHQSSSLSASLLTNYSGSDPFGSVGAFGCTASGSLGFDLELWAWCVAAMALCCCACNALCAVAATKTGKKPSKNTARARQAVRPVLAQAPEPVHEAAQERPGIKFNYLEPAPEATEERTKDPLLMPDIDVMKQTTAFAPLRSGGSFCTTYAIPFTTPATTPSTYNYLVAPMAPTTYNYAAATAAELTPAAVL